MSDIDCLKMSKTYLNEFCRVIYESLFFTSFIIMAFIDNYFWCLIITKMIERPLEASIGFDLLKNQHLKINYNKCSLHSKNK